MIHFFQKLLFAGLNLDLRSSCACRKCLIWDDLLHSWLFLSRALTYLREIMLYRRRAGRQVDVPVADSGSIGRWAAQCGGCYASISSAKTKAKSQQRQGVRNGCLRVSAFVLFAKNISSLGQVRILAEAIYADPFFS